MKSKTQKYMWLIVGISVLAILYQCGWLLHYSIEYQYRVKLSLPLSTKEQLEQINYVKGEILVAVEFHIIMIFLSLLNIIFVTLMQRSMNFPPSSREK